MVLDFIAATRGSARQRERLPAETRAWLSSLSTVDPPGNAREVIQRLVALNRLELDTRLWLRILDKFRDYADWLLPQLESRLARAPPPLAGNCGK